MILDSLGNWTAVGAAAVTAVTDADDATYIQSPTNPSVEQVRFQLDPVAAGSITVTVKAQASATGYLQLRTVLQEGTTTIAEWTDELTTSWQTFVYPLNGSQNAAVTNRSNLFVLMEAN